jgi:hypothetical protein
MNSKFIIKKIDNHHHESFKLLPSKTSWLLASCASAKTCGKR